ncbi:3-hydroxyacyl-CoA dehydrogenase type-2-like protein [Leptotrombidium deliense]|uniref:3-hydroxyacyl-CoA dehydrogenase type-2-like protein n=1 Tax=Leptotrombidium deliense TaxID=299467 RepID=A0A443SEZ3_9ACAR|nr:3-hydroxyacyl-CoA dehydrogenase type-2-like protein [Leptotrombidium deliense]
MSSATSLRSAVALVTGAASGLGKGTVKQLLERGVSGILAMDIQKFTCEYPENVLTCRGNVSSEEDVKNALNMCKERFGKLNVVVNCAGISVAFKLYNFHKQQAHDFDDARKVLETNVLGTFNVNRLAVGLLAANEPENGIRGVLINTSSISSMEGSVGQIVHAAASGAINSMTLPMARDLAEQGIRVMTIAPGIFKTPLVERMPDVALNFLSEITLCPRRLGEPEEFGQLVTAIIENPLLNGEVIRIDGGLRLPG